MRGSARDRSSDILPVRALAATTALLLGCGPVAPTEEPDGGTTTHDDARVPPGDGGAPGDGAAPNDGGPRDASVAHDGGAPLVVPDADPTFGAGGMTLVNVANEWIGPVWSLEVQPDGKILAGGRTSDALVVLRALPDGTLDPGFGTGGMASIAVGGSVLAPTTAMGLGSIALAPDGSIVVSSFALLLDARTQVELVARLTPGGALDPSFGEGGVVIGDTTVPEGAVANAVAVQPDGRIVVAARNHVDRLLPDGSLDPSFASGGRLATTLGGAWADFQAIVIDSAGRIVVSGAQAAVGSGQRVFVMRLTPAGALDTGFAGGAGHVFDAMGDTGIVPMTRARSVALDGGGRIIVGAMRTPGRATLSVGRFTAGGALDTTFGSGGWASADDGVSYGGTTALIAIQSDGRIVAMGGSGVGGRPAQIVRFTEDGAIDTTFGEAGVGAFLTYDASLGLALGAGDAIVLSGLGRGGTYLGRLSADGATDAAFAGDGALELPTSGGYDRVLSALVQPDGRILLGGTASALNLGALVRLMPDGSIDESLGIDGRVPRAGLDAVSSIALDASGRVLIGGPGTNLRVLRLSPDGSADPSFGDAGAFSVGSTRGANMAVGADGRVYVAGYARVLLGPTYLGVKRLLADGTADPAFGTGGETLVELPSRDTYAIASHAVLAVQPDGRVVVSGSVLVRLEADGTLDETFGTAGVATGGEGAQAIAVAGDGRIVLARRTARPGEAAELVVERRSADGALDPSFGGGGRTSVPLGRVGPAVAGVVEPIGLSLEDDGSILVATTSGDDEGLREHATLVRLASDGTPDAAFGPGGRRVLALGRASSALHAIARDADGTTLLVGRAHGDASATSDMMALRLR